MKEELHNGAMDKKWRKTSQYLLPLEKKRAQSQGYDIYPVHKIADGKVYEGFASVADTIAGKHIVAIDGYTGVFFSKFADEINKRLRQKGLRINIIETSSLFKPEEEVFKMCDPFLGGNDPLFGKRTTLSIKDFFDPEKVDSDIFDNAADINFIIGPGASLIRHSDQLIYIDLPKNELQFRMRAGSATNLGVSKGSDPKEMYKRSYFVDWIVLNRHKESIINSIGIFVDGQRPDNPVWMYGDDLRMALAGISRSFFRVRPWFEPGTWGGTWIKDNIEGLSSDVPNYAWSFELITPENGLVIESSSLMLETSFDSLMYVGAKSVLGDCHNRFGNEFPIRFDFLDTFDGGNLSLQCHPRQEYITSEFGESFTQEECYYILDTKEDAVVFLGFKDDIDKDLFEDDLNESFSAGKPIDPEKYINKLPASKHDLFLIPGGTIHGSGKNNLVLEISSTPYIFTFKMYDWLRPDLDGKPRPLNIKRGMDNLFFDRKGKYVTDKLISKPYLLDSGSDWQLWHLPTHETQLYDVHRYVFRTTIEFDTCDKCFVMSLVDGEKIEVSNISGLRQQFNYAETFVISAAAGKITITNLSDGCAMVVKAFVK
jgi:mannose-6-phosphate isomerase class I